MELRVSKSVLVFQLKEQASAFECFPPRTLIAEISINGFDFCKRRKGKERRRAIVCLVVIVLYSIVICYGEG